jgi:hypothetical protein
MSTSKFNQTSLMMEECNYLISYYDHEQIIYLYVLSPLALIGILLNALCVYIYGNRSFSTSSTAFKYLRYLSVVDLLICCIQLPYTLSFYTQAANKHDYLRGHLFLIYIYLPIANMLSNLATLLTLLVTIERLVSVKWPTRKARLFSSSRFCFSCMLAIAISVAVNFVYFFYFRLNNCYDLEPNKFTNTFFMKSFTYIREALMRIIPILIMSVSNTIIIRTVRASRRRMKRSAKATTPHLIDQSNEQASPGKPSMLALNNLVNDNSMMIDLVESKQADAKEKRPLVKKVKKAQKLKKDNQITYMAIFVFVLYTIGSVPMLIVIPNVFFSNEQLQTFEYKELAAIANLLELSQSFLRFFIYFCFTTQFRLVFYGIFSKTSKQVI